MPTRLSPKPTLRLYLATPACAVRYRAALLADSYGLWTLKESLLKAIGLGLADMPQVGLRQEGQDWRLCAGGCFWQGAVFLLGGEWLCAAVWPLGAVAEWEWRGFGAWQAVEKQLLYRFT